MKRAALLLRCSTNIQDYNRQKLELEKVANRFKLKVAKVFGEHVTGGKSSVSCPLKPSDSAPLKHSTMPP